MAEAPTYTAALIGAGRIASSLEADPLRAKPASHAGAYAAHPATRLAAAADTDPGALRACGAAWGLPPERLYADYREMLERERPDVVSVCAYAPDRLEMTRAALAAGAKGLWLEKALGCSLADALEIQRAVAEAGAACVVDYPRRGRRTYRALRLYVGDGRYGRLQSVVCHMTPQLLHTGTHAFDVLRFWCGEALAATGCLERGFADPRDLGDQGGHALLRMASGTTAFVSASPKDYYIFQFDAVFEKARFMIGNDIEKAYFPDRSVNYTGYDELFERPDFEFEAPRGPTLLDALLEAVESGREPLYSASNAVEALRIGLAIFASSGQGGRPVAPQDVDPAFRVANV